MTSRRIANFAIEGTSALKSQATEKGRNGATIIEFPRKFSSCNDAMTARLDGSFRSRILTKFRAILAASEMYCSLKFEDFRGCQYHRFNRRGIAVLTTATAMIAVAAIIAGA